MYCAHCATPVPEDARFCHSCGSLVSDAEGQAAATGSMDKDAFAHMEELLRTETAGEFEVERMLGRGGMAVVYLATEVHLSRKVAIKVLPPELTFGHGVERFKREAKTAAALDHPNIIPIYRIASGGKLFWYAMKFLEGKALDELLREENSYPLDKTYKILKQVADALDYGHEHQVIHRDIKPANIMLSSRGQVVVTDFGIAKALTEGTLTASGSVIGTPYFMSPEQGMGKTVTGRADQYSVSVMAYRMLSGQVPFEGDSAIDILHKHCMMPPPPLETVCPGLPKHTYLAVHKALEKDPERRFSTVTEFVHALKEPRQYTPHPGERTSESEVATVVVQAPPDLSGAPTADGSLPGVAAGSGATAQPMAAPVAKSRRWLMSLVAAVAVAAAGVTGWVTLGPGGDSATTEPVAAATAAQESTLAAAPPAEDTTQVAAPPVDTAPTTGLVTVTGLPRGGRVFWDGEQRDTEFEVPPGNHTVELRASGYLRQRTQISVAAGVTVALPFVAERAPQQPAAATPRPAPREPPPTERAQPAAPAVATLQVAVRPRATIFIDGQSFGEQGRFEHELSAGVAHHIRFVRENFVSWDTTVTPVAGGTIVLRKRLESN